MKTEERMFHVCSEVNKQSANNRKGVSIAFVCAKGLDVERFAIAQASSLLKSSKDNLFKLDTAASSVLFIEGHKTVSEIASDFATYEDADNLAKIKIFSVPEHNAKVKSNSLDPDITVVDPIIIDDIVDYAEGEKQPSVVFHDFHSLSAGKLLCKAYGLRDLHNQLKAKGVLQIYFVNSETEAMQIAVKPDLIFNIKKDSDAELHPTIKVSLHSASARLQDTILPTELELVFNENGTWKVKTSVNEADKNQAIKYLAILGKTHKQIAAAIGDISASTVGRRIQAMHERGEVLKQGHSITVLDAKKTIKTQEKP